MGKPKVYRPGEHVFPLELSPDLNLDLHAFCELHYGASKAEVVRRALVRLIKEETKQSYVATEFGQIRRRLAEESEPEIRLVRTQKTADGGE